MKKPSKLVAAFEEDNNTNMQFDGNVERKMSALFKLATFLQEDVIILEDPEYALNKGYE